MCVYQTFIEIIRQRESSITKKRFHILYFILFLIYYKHVSNDQIIWYSLHALTIDSTSRYRQLLFARTTHAWTRKRVKGWLSSETCICAYDSMIPTNIQDREKKSQTVKFLILIYIMWHCMSSVLFWYPFG